MSGNEHDVLDQKSKRQIENINEDLSKRIDKTNRRIRVYTVIVVILILLMQFWGASTRGSLEGHYSYSQRMLRTLTFQPIEAKDKIDNIGDISNVSQYLKGEKGANGSAGAQGPAGVDGQSGQKGDTGAAGAQGPAGVDINGTQTLSFVGTNLSISGGNSINLVSLYNDNDFDPANEIQGAITGGGIYRDGSNNFGLLNSCAAGELLKWSGSTWACGIDAGAASGAPTDATYLTLSNNVNLSTERALAVGTSLTATDGGANGAFTLNTIQDIRTTASPTFSGLNLTNLTVAGDTINDFSGNGLSVVGNVLQTNITLGSLTTGDYVQSVSAGSGINVSGSGGEGSTPTIGLDSSIAIFKTIDASLGTDPIADSLTDTLSLTSGNGVNVTGDSSTDSISFAVNAATNGGLSVGGAGVSLLTTCSNNQVLQYNSSTSTWACATLSSASNLFSTIAGDTGSAAADSSSDTVTLIGGNGIDTTGADSPDSITFNIAVASGGGLTFSGGSLSLISCTEGEILKFLSSQWSCSSDNGTATNSEYREHLQGVDDRTVSSSATPLLTNGSGTALNLPITITSGSEVSIIATSEVNSTLATGAVNFSIVRDDNNDNDCATGGGDGTTIGGTFTANISAASIATTISFTFIDTNPGATTVGYQLCTSTAIATGTVTARDRTLYLTEINL